MSSISRAKLRSTAPPHPPIVQDGGPLRPPRHLTPLAQAHFKNSETFQDEQRRGRRIQVVHLTDRQRLGCDLVYRQLSRSDDSDPHMNNRNRAASRSACCTLTQVGCREIRRSCDDHPAGPSCMPRHAARGSAHAMARNTQPWQPADGLRSPSGFEHRVPPRPWTAACKEARLRMETPRCERHSPFYSRS